MEKVATDIYTFSRLREEGFVYVDKTEHLYALACGENGSQFFLARPRRFGKSLAVSTFRALFEGRRDLFQGLAIEPKWDWSKKRPVLHLDMGSAQAETVPELNAKWLSLLKDEANRNGVDFNADTLPSIAFKDLILALAAKSPDRRIALLLDEYDKPLLNHLCKPDVIRFRDALKAFYSVIKTMEDSLRFTFITGVSKFSKVSIFSDLNNLKDWTMHPEAATLFGYTHEEVLKYFPERIHKLGEANGLDDKGAFDEIVRWYDGYKFHQSAKPVINPVSLGLCFDSNEFKNYWSQTAMPTFLVDILKTRPLDFSAVDIDEADLGNYEPDRPKGVTLLFQTGYLTIDSFTQMGSTRHYSLRIPNMEVEN